MVVLGFTFHRIVVSSSPLTPAAGVLLLSAAIDNPLYVYPHFRSRPLATPAGQGS